MRVAVVGGGSTYTPELIDGFARLDAGLTDADVVLLQLRVGGQTARVSDETFPLECGCVGQETTGAGGLAKALRTVPVVLDLAGRVRERAARDAWILAKPALLSERGGRRARRNGCVFTGGMPLRGEYEPSASERARKQVEEYEGSGGTSGTTMMGLPVVILTTLGAKSGKIRKTPLMRVADGDQYAVVASLGGAPKHPVWYHNVKSHPEVELQDGPNKQEMTAREVTGDEKARWWDIAVRAYPPYADYQKKTSREIPVFVLSPKK